VELLIHHHTTTMQTRRVGLVGARRGNLCVGNLGLVPSGAGHALVLGPAGWFQNAANFEPIVDAILSKDAAPLS
jgi:hypothetical protein